MCDHMMCKLAQVNRWCCACVYFLLTIGSTLPQCDDNYPPMLVIGLLEIEVPLLCFCLAQRIYIYFVGTDDTG